MKGTSVFFNGLKTAFLLGLLMALCMGIGLIWGKTGLTFGFIFGGLGVVISYFFSDKIALASMSAHEISREEAPELYAMVEDLAKRAALPTPRLYYSPQPAPNAFATGRNPKHGVVCVTAGLMQMLNSQELKGVLAHEISHIKHRDILISSVAAVIAGAISYVAHMAWWFGLGGRNNGDREQSPLTLVAGLLMIILAPLAAMLIQMAISRSREFAADSAGAYFAGGPEGLISALRKLEVGNRQVPMDINPSESHMFIIRPRMLEASSLMELFKTHPNTETRIAKLIEQMNQENPYAATV